MVRGHRSLQNDYRPPTILEWSPVIVFNLWYTAFISLFFEFCGNSTPPPTLAYTNTHLHIDFIYQIIFVNLKRSQIFSIISLLNTFYLPGHFLPAFLSIICHIILFYSTVSKTPCIKLIFSTNNSYGSATSGHKLQRRPESVQRSNFLPYET